MTRTQQCAVGQEAVHAHVHTGRQPVHSETLNYRHTHTHTARRTCLQAFFPNSRDITKAGIDIITAM